MPNMSVSSGDFLKSYGRIVEAALREPVTITSHGRERLVLLSADEYRRLKEKDREALYPWELADADLTALEVAEPPAEATAFDPETHAK
ncbi:MAG TPA: type II toxin-antitoxin system Phd/YefM family antitoxin [Caulobacteraceae bacterium]